MDNEGQLNIDTNSKPVKDVCADLLKCGQRSMRYHLKRTYFNGKSPNEVRTTSPLKVFRVSLTRVVLVDQGAYDACNTSASFVGGRFNNGSMVFTFDLSGPFFFISGNKANCRAGEKLIVVVMADCSGRHTPPPAFLQNVGLESAAPKRSGKAVVAARVEELETELEAEKQGYGKFTDVVLM
ncbi:hypothetical protein E2562_012450 [Oryza meyeriana var. granulata]|uniref:Phytocyanin domain-containing protein n=1 Tax=Oryza meyeriana var. granulata TaxID=110450 RepID=A0A6G1C5J1_9ORYZ|nr:hypothetical protein E2562_012450 [Oryza meyeriana var. granulata]